VLLNWFRKWPMVVSIMFILQVVKDVLDELLDGLKEHAKVHSCHYYESSLNLSV
jgi:hypothetical protein